PVMVLEAFRQGADGVIIGGCHPGDCHYEEGNLYARRRIRILKKMMEFTGIDPRRLRLEWISASEGKKFQQVLQDFTSTLKELGTENKLEGYGER
ncbi:hypothetical protein AKJ65_05880, partial [candidate division MSBL1 archaeon SCGC-AAA259E19]